MKSNRGDAIKAPIPGYGVQDFEWEVQYNQDKPAVKLNGTVEQVQAKLLQLNPNYEVDMADIIAKYHKEREEASTAFQARDLNKRDWTICNNFPDAANVYGGVNGGSGIQGGIDYLRGVAGSPTNGPGPGNCGRVSCDYGAAIWWCNDVSTDDLKYIQANMQLTGTISYRTLIPLPLTRIMILPMQLK